MWYVSCMRYILCGIMKIIYHIFRNIFFHLHYRLFSLTFSFWTVCNITSPLIYYQHIFVSLYLFESVKEEKNFFFIFLFKKKKFCRSHHTIPIIVTYFEIFKMLPIYWWKVSLYIKTPNAATSKNFHILTLYVMIFTIRRRYTCSLRTPKIWIEVKFLRIYVLS